MGVSSIVGQQTRRPSHAEGDDMSRMERPETLTDAVARYVRDAIVHGDYAPGSALPEIRLATELGTSRGTVREALRGLEDQGLV